MTDDASQDDLIGKTLGQFTILEEIGRGGMATVYSAMQQSMNRKVAIKILPRHFMHDPGFLERFEREVEVISTLEHPHILPIYDYGEVDGIPYIAMRFLGGGSMAQMVRRGVPDLNDLEKPFRQVAAALDYAHMRGIIHRDLKPGNIMLDEDGNAYLSDFGIARVMGSDLTGSAIIGTPAYMSPEQAHGVAIDARSDIYALGIVLFELITGREPYQAETPMGLLLMHLNEPLPEIDDLRDDVPVDVKLVIEQATMKDPDDRYPSAGKMSDAFSAALRGEAITQQSTPTKSIAEPEPFDSSATLPPTKRAGSGGTVIGGEKAIPSPVLDSPETAAAQSSATAVTPAQTQQRSPLVMLMGLLVLIALGAGGIFIASEAGLFDDDDSPEAALIIPTPFRSAETINRPDYVLSVPTRWESIDRSDVNRIYNLWQEPDETMFASLALTDEDRDAYENRYYAERESLSLIDEATLTGDVLRRSYRVDADDDLENGQLDVFYRERGEDELAVIEIYTADSVAGGETTLETLQLILDSVRIKQGNPRSDDDAPGRGPQS